MIIISHFETVLEIAFGLNSLLYILDLLPHFEEKLLRIADDCERLTKEKIELTKNEEVYPIGFVIGYFHHVIKSVLSILTICVSILILAVLLYGSFVEDGKIAVYWMISLLAVGYGIPLLAIWLHSRTVRLMEAARQRLQNEIHEAKMAKVLKSNV